MEDDFTLQDILDIASNEPAKFAALVKRYLPPERQFDVARALTGMDVYVKGINATENTGYRSSGNR